MARKKTIVAISIATLLATVLLTFIFKVDFDIKGHFEGLYLLHNKADGSYDVVDHLFVGEGQQLIYGTTLNSRTFKLLDALLPEHDENRTHLHVDWNPKDGSGLVSNLFKDGSKLVTYFGRYLDNDRQVHGLFVGGGLPETVTGKTNYNMNNSGMTFYDGNRWYHIWCSVNEGIDFSGPTPPLTPSEWKFLGSRVINRSDTNAVIESSHQVSDGVNSVKIVRTASFTAGEPYFNLEIRVSNTGTKPVHYTYFYGDEPWVGYYGTSLGDVGWVKDRLITHEAIIDSSKYSYAGMADLGNPAIGEQPVYTNLANFIEWVSADRPIVYFTNTLEMPKNNNTPLESNERFIGLQWTRELPPGSNQTIRLNIGMATYNPKTGLPQKPATTW